MPEEKNSCEFREFHWLSGVLPSMRSAIQTARRRLPYMDCIMLPCNILRFNDSTGKSTFLWLSLMTKRLVWGFQFVLAASIPTGC